MIKTRKLKMWMVQGKCGGLRSLWSQKWQAEEAIRDWNYGVRKQPLPVSVIIKYKIEKK